MNRDAFGWQRAQHRRWIARLAGPAFVATLLLGSAVPASAATPAARSATTPAGTRLPVLSWVAPTKERPAFNVRHAGRLVLVNFSLGGDYGLDVLEPSWPRSQDEDCTSGALTPGTQWRTRPFGELGLSYDAATQTYTYGWQTHAEWQNAGLECRRFQLRLSDDSRYSIHFRFTIADRVDAPSWEHCTDITDGNGAYFSKDPTTHDPLPYPHISFAVFLGAPSCAPTGDGDTRYRFVVLSSDKDANPYSFVPVVTRTFIGDGSTDTLLYSIDLTKPNPPRYACMYSEVMQGGRVIERAPNVGCSQYLLDGGPPGRNDYN